MTRKACAALSIYEVYVRAGGVLFLLLHLLCMMMSCGMWEFSDTNRRVFGRTRAAFGRAGFFSGGFVCSFFHFSLSFGRASLPSPSARQVLWSCEEDKDG